MSAETKYREGLEALERGNKACVSPRPRDAKLAAGTDLGTTPYQLRLPRGRITKTLFKWKPDYETAAMEYNKAGAC